MSRTPGNSDEDLAVAVAPDSSGPNALLPELLPDDVLVSEDADSVLAEASEPTPDADAALLVREAEANAADVTRAAAIACARALAAERRDDAEAALALWRGAFDRAPGLLVAFWGLRRALAARGAWQEVAEAIERRIAAVAGTDARAMRAELWLERGRLMEDRLARDGDAAASYRAGVGEMADHAGLLLSSLLLGWRSGDGAMVVDALAGLLLRPLAPSFRAALTAALARLERMAMPAPSDAGDAPAGTSTGDAAAAAPLDPAAARRALTMLREALRSVTADEAAPLVAELGLLARATADPRARVDVLDEMLVHVAPDDAAGAAALLRERARVLGGSLDDRAGAVASLRDALARAPGHPVLVAEIADAIEASEPDAARAAEALSELRALVAANAAPEVVAELGLRIVVALARAGRTAEALAFWDAHPELPRDRPDGFALQIALGASAGDLPGLAAAFERAAGGGVAAAHALVLAGTLVELAPAPPPVDDTAGGTASAGARARALELYERALAEAPGYEPADEAVERRLWADGRFAELGSRWQARLDAAATPEGVARAGRAGRAPSADLLEELVALHRDDLDDPAAAARLQDALIAGGDADARAWARRWDLEIGAVERDRARAAAPGESAGAGAVLAALADRAGSPAVGAALLVASGRAAAAAGQRDDARDRYRAALSADTTGVATSGLERLAGAHDGGARAELVRAEIARLSARGGGGDAESDGRSGARLRALRFRLAAAAAAAPRTREALDALEPLRIAGDTLAHAATWEIARRAGDARLEVGVLRGAPDDVAAARLQAPTDLGEALERAGDRVGAAAAFRAALDAEPSADAALGLLRAAVAAGDSASANEAARTLVRFAGPQTAALLAPELALLSLVDGAAPDAAPAIRAVRGERNAGDGDGHGGGAADAVARWVAGVRGGDALGAASGLLALARAVPTGATSEAAADRNGLLARAAARARLGTAALAAAVHDQVHAISDGAAAVGVGLADLPVGGRSERASARVARAERNGGRLGYALDLERALDAEARGDAVGALDAFARALAREPEGIEAVEGIRRVAEATGNRRGAARAGLRLGAMLRAPLQASAELVRAGQILEELGETADAATAYWQALGREPDSPWLHRRLADLLAARGDAAGLDRLLGVRLALRDDPAGRIAVLAERAEHRLARMNDRKGGIEDFKRILKIVPEHPRALARLAELAMQMQHFPQAIAFLQRRLAIEADEAVAAALRLDLAAAYEAARQPAKAIETLRQGVAARRGDAVLRARLTEVLLATGDSAGALEALRGWERMLGNLDAKAEIWVRIGCLQRDNARDPTAAATAFATAAELNPLGDGVLELLALHERTGARTARREAAARAIADMRRALVAAPLDVERLHRLHELGELADAVRAREAARTGADVARQILDLLGDAVDLDPPRSEAPRGPLGPVFWGRLKPEAASGFAGEIWPLLAAAAVERFAAPEVPRGARASVAPGAEPRLAWVEDAAVAVGLPGLELALVRDGDPADEGAVALEGAHPTLLLGRGVLGGAAAARFHVGRALLLLRDRAVVLERVTDADAVRLFELAAVIAGAGASADAAADAAARDEETRQFGRAMARKDRRALELEVSRFGFEPVDAAAFREATLNAADRLGLVLAGDLAAAVRAVCDLESDAPRAPVIAAEPRALGLIRYALGEDYLAALEARARGA